MGDRDKEPNLEEQCMDGRFSFGAIFSYLRYQQYPEGSTKLQKNSLRRRSKYFRLENQDLYYMGGGRLYDF